MNYKLWTIWAYDLALSESTISHYLSLWSRTESLKALMSEPRIMNKHKNKFTHFRNRLMWICVKKIWKITASVNVIFVSKRKASCVTSYRKFQAFVHISTAYCHCEEPVLQEVTYPSPHDPQTILHLVEWLDDDVLVSITPKWVQESKDTCDFRLCKIITTQSP